MKKMISYALISGLLCACDSTNTPPVFIDLEANETAILPFSNTSAPSTTVITLQALSTVDLYSIQINRGECPLFKGQSPSSHLEYGQKIQVSAHCDVLDIREITVNSRDGNFIFNF